MKLFCCQCGGDVKTRLTSGVEIYPHRPDLAKLPFWKCDACKNYVGCHHKTKNRTRPLGNIPSHEIKKARQHIHAILDPLWKTGQIKRGRLYGIISDEIGYEYHTAELKSIEECRKVYRIVLKMMKGFL